VTRNSPCRAAARPLPFVLHCLALAAPLALLLAASPAARAQAYDPARADVAQFIGEMQSRSGFDAEALRALFAQVESRPSILAAIARPAERTLTWDEYRAKFLNERRITRGAAVHTERQAELERAAAASGVPVDVMLAIVGVETLYGENVGKHRVIDALATLAFDYPPRSKFFRSELENFLVMAREEQIDPLRPVGSYAGAMGLPQFMPSSFRNFALDGDADGRRDLWNDWADVFASVGNYLAKHGWRAGEPVMVRADATGANLDGIDPKLALSETVGSLKARGVRFDTDLPASAPAMLVTLRMVNGTQHRVGFTNFYAITRYNRSHLYATAVNDLAEAIGAVRRGEDVAAFVAPPAPPRPVEALVPPTPAAVPGPATAPAPQAAPAPFSSGGSN
jgi:membrane-bound lytic murein transglycosylase B